MAEPHDPLLAGQRVQDALLRLVRIEKLLEQFECGFVCPTVQRTAQRADGGRDRRVEVRASGGDQTGSKRGGGQFVLGIEDHRDVQRPAVQLHGGNAAEQPQKVSGEGRLFRLGLDPANIPLVMIPVEQHRRENRQQAVGDLARIGPRSFRLETTQRRTAGPQHVHWVRGNGQLLKQRFERFGQDPQRGQALPIVVQFLAAGKPPVQQQIGDFFETALDGQISNGVAAVGQARAGRADVGNGRLAHHDPCQSARFLLIHLGSPSAAEGDSKKWSSPREGLQLVELLFVHVAEPKAVPKPMAKLVGLRYCCVISTVLWSAACPTLRFGNSLQDILCRRGVRGRTAWREFAASDNVSGYRDGPEEAPGPRCN